MNPIEVGLKIRERLHVEPFQPFEIQMLDGRVIELKKPALAVAFEGASMLTDDDEFVEIDFANVQDIRASSSKAHS